MGVRSLCNGIGPALFGLVFFLSGVDLYYNESLPSDRHPLLNKTYREDLNTNSKV